MFVPEEEKAGYRPPELTPAALLQRIVALEEEVRRLRQQLTHIQNRLTAIGAPGAPQ